MPIRFGTTTLEAETYAQAFKGRLDHSVGINVNLALLTAREIDAKGYLKPGVPFAKDGTLVGIAPDFVYGVTIEPIKVMNDNLPATIAAAGVQNIAVGVIGMVLRQVCVDNIGAALTADELAGFDRPGSKLVLIG